jgi:glycosyltransferase involved in cell wall biosynthesis
MRDKLVCFFDIPAHQISVIRNAVLPLSQQGQQYLKTLSKVQVRRELRVPESIYLVLFAGRLNPSKGFLDLFHAMKTVVADDNDVHLFVAGGGEGYFHAKEFVDVNHLEANIHLLGYRSDIPLLLKAADLLVLPSYAEGVPRILLEAFEIGTPVLVSDIPSLKEVVQHGKSGGVFELGSTADICRSILAAKRSRIKTETWVANASKKLKSHNYCQMVNEYVRLIED